MKRFSLRGVLVPHRKNTKDKPVVRMSTPDKLVIPMGMHIGKAARPIVKVGDLVKIGTKIGEADGMTSVPVHSGVSGKVVEIRDFLLSDGAKVPAVVIESDGEMTSDETLTPPVVDSGESLMSALKESGIVGLGGAGFPTYVKFHTDLSGIEYLVINGAECEPYVTVDTVTMVERSADMEYALRATSRYFGLKKAVIGMEADKKEAIASMKRLSEKVRDACELQVKVLPPVYPQGGERVLVYHTTGRRVPAKKFPVDIGCIVLNCTTLAAIGAYLRTGMPLVEKCVTVDGGAVKNPQNVLVPIGTSMADLFRFCGGLTEEPAKLIYGGPMMGHTVPDASAPVLKNTNAVLALTESEARLPETTACIRCGACTNHCPFGLAPAAISRALEKEDKEQLRALAVMACMECGCCSFVCPANRPLVQSNRLAKACLREEKEEAKHG